MPDHLVKWRRIVARENAAKNAIARYARLFSLQHYWRLIHERHAIAVKRQACHLRAAFATFFDVSPDSIRKDLTSITKGLGSGWERRPNPLA